VVAIQYKLKRLASELLSSESVDKDETSAEFKRLMWRWTLLGIPAFAAILAVFVLMVLKPLPLV